MRDAIPFLATGVALGLSAGFFPGPLMALVASQTLRHGPGEGAKAAFAPLLTDGPILVLSTLLLARLSAHPRFLGLVSLLGGAFLLFLAYENLTARGIEVDSGEETPRSVRKGILVNALSPHPYLFWITVGAPTILKGLEGGLLPPAAFAGGFLGCLVGAKLLVAVLVGRSRRFLAGRTYLLLVRLLGGALAAYAVVLFRDGYRLLGGTG